jgi:hypothetical protein
MHESRKLPPGGSHDDRGKLTSAALANRLVYLLVTGGILRQEDSEKAEAIVVQEVDRRKALFDY